MEAVNDNGSRGFLIYQEVVAVCYVCCGFYETMFGKPKHVRKQLHLEGE